LPTPDIFRKESGSIPVIGGRLSLVCRVNVDINTGYVSFNWGYPDKDHAEKVAVFSNFLSSSMKAW
jgi:hypothetical protein